MKKLVLSAVAAVALAGTAYTYNAIAAPDSPDGAPPHARMEFGFLLDAKLAGMKAALKLTADQEKLWTPFESAVRDGAKERRDAMRALRDQREGDDRPSPIAMLTNMSERLAKTSEVLKKVAEAGKPLYDSLDDGQKSHFGPLLHMLRDGGRGHDGPRRL